MNKPQNTPHVHATVIKAWANGAKIQRRAPNASHIGYREWHDDTPPMDWFPNWEYRVKPDPVFPKSTMAGTTAWNVYSSSTDLTCGEALLLVADEAIKEFISSGEAEKYFKGLKE